MLPKANAIIERYRDFAFNENKERLLPVHSNQKMNEYLKELATICGIYKNLSMHVVRHTFATSVTLSNGVPLDIASKVLRHNLLKTTQISLRLLSRWLMGYQLRRFLKTLGRTSIKTAQICDRIVNATIFRGYEGIREDNRGGMNGIAPIYMPKSWMFMAKKKVGFTVLFALAYFHCGWPAIGIVDRILIHIAKEVAD